MLPRLNRPPLLLRRRRRDFRQPFALWALRALFATACRKSHLRSPTIYRKNVALTVAWHTVKREEAAQIIGSGPTDDGNSDQTGDQGDKSGDDPCGCDTG